MWVSAWGANNHVGAIFPQGIPAFIYETRPCQNDGSEREYCNIETCSLDLPTRIKFVWFEFVLVILEFLVNSQLNNNIFDEL